RGDLLQHLHGASPQTFGPRLLARLLRQLGIERQRTPSPFLLPRALGQLERVRRQLLCARAFAGLRRNARFGEPEEGRQRAIERRTRALHVLAEALERRQRRSAERAARRQEHLLEQRLGRVLAAPELRPAPRAILVLVQRLLRVARARVQVGPQTAQLRSERTGQRRRIAHLHQERARALQPSEVEVRVTQVQERLIK